jgi:hypothetical protein
VLSAAELGLDALTQGRTGHGHARDADGGEALLEQRVDVFRLLRVGAVDDQLGLAGVLDGLVQLLELCDVLLAAQGGSVVGPGAGRFFPASGSSAACGDGEHERCGSSAYAETACDTVQLHRYLFLSESCDCRGLWWRSSAVASSATITA